MIIAKKIGQKVRDLRESLGLSQLELAQKMGFSRVTITHIEAGKRELESSELIAFARIFGIDPGSFLRDDDPAPDFVGQKKISNYIFSKQKLENLILYILERCGGKPNLGETVLYKLLYFCDFDACEISGQPITGLSYVKLQYGPVPRAQEYSTVIKSMILEKKLKIITQEYHGLIQKRYIALKEWSRATLSEQEKNIINEVVSKYSDMNARSIESYVHGDIPWRETGDEEIIPYNLVYQRVPPYSHANHDNDFVQAGLSDVWSDLGPMSKAENEYYKSI